MTHSRALLRVRLSRLALAIAAAHTSCGDGAEGSAEPSPMGTVQNSLPVAELLSRVTQDPAFGEALAFAREVAGTSDVTAAGTLADSEGVTIDYGVLSTSPLIEVLRRCGPAGCVSVVQEPGPDADSVTWRTRAGPVEVEGIAHPFQLRLISNDEDPDDGAVIATEVAPLDGTPRAAGGKVRILSAFNRYMTVYGESLRKVADSARKGVTDVTSRTPRRRSASTPSSRHSGPRTSSS